MIDQRREAEAQLEEAQDKPQSSIDLDSLQKAIEAARTAGVAAALVDAVEAGWARGSSNRQKAEDNLASVRDPARSQPDPGRIPAGSRPDPSSDPTLGCDPAMHGSRRIPSGPIGSHRIPIVSPVTPDACGRW